ncbi:Zinc finger protein [Armadillidium nasatum]|uniref:Zinc finger protein n=1 Tax=Armadillidium nasatum TaxID=96803 RepID=A0A5N5TA64_9CRUS|nr:Zinc finger protein [Armadillidium nasatum]
MLIYKKSYFTSGSTITMKYFKRKKIFSYYSLEQNKCFEIKSNTLYNNNKSSIDSENENRVEQNAMTTLRESKLPVVLVQKLNIGEKIYADGKEVGISVSEEDCDTPELYVFSSDDINSSLNKEKEAPELKKDKYQCPLCTYVTHKKGHLNQHQLVHSEVKLFSCSQCSYKSKRKNNLKSHALRHSSSSANLLECVKCNFRTTFSSQFKKHMLQHTSVDKLDCEDDDYPENSKSYVDKQPNSENGAKLFICSKCAYKTKYESIFARHMSKRHTNIQPLHCSECDFVTNEKNELECHLLKCSERDFDIVSKKCLNIQTLEQSSEDKLDFEEDGIENHINDTKDNKKIFKCSKCNFETKYGSNLSRHMLRHADLQPSNEDKLDCEENGIENQKNDADKLSNTKDIKKLFQCSKCDFETKYKKSVDRHMSKKHLDEPPLHCTNVKTFDAHLESNHIENSDEDSQSSGNSKPTTDDTQHLDTPSGEEDLMWHKCPHCEFRTKKSQYFKRHMPKHSIFKYKCEFCNYKTHRKAFFATHLKLHEDQISFSNSEEEVNETLFECPDCSFKTKRKSAFNSHISQHTNKTLLSCFECDFQTPNEDELDSHILSHTKTKNVERYIPNLKSEDDLKIPRLKRAKVEQVLQNENNVIEVEEPMSEEIRWYDCPNCNFKANNKRFLDSHLRTHFGKKSVHECSICSYRTVSKQNLKVHMFKHSDFNLKI